MSQSTKSRPASGVHLDEEFAHWLFKGARWPLGPLGIFIPGFITMILLGVAWSTTDTTMWWGWRASLVTLAFVPLAGFSMLVVEGWAVLVAHNDSVGPASKGCRCKACVAALDGTRRGSVWVLEK